MDIILYVYIGYIVAACLLAIRLILGPTAPDRVVVVDAFTTIVIAMLVMTSLYFMRNIYLDIALLVAVLSFVGTVAISKYLEGRELREGAK
jgi:multicomponent Na+:H+ antiporter subunit F